MANHLQHAKQFDLFESGFEIANEGMQRQLTPTDAMLIAQLTQAETDNTAIKAAFRKWDLDGDGTIDKYELMMVMRQLCHVDESDLEALLQEADTNQDGEVQYEEFVDWLMKPAVNSQVMAIFDYSDVLRPLFDAYDRGGSGAITFEEFQECHDILHGAFEMNNNEAEDEEDKVEKKVMVKRNEVHEANKTDEVQSTLDKTNKQDAERNDRKTHKHDALLMSEDSTSAFKLTDANNDGQVTFREFVNWMRDFIDESDIDKAEIQMLAARVGMMLRSCLKQIDIVQESGFGDKDKAEVETFKDFMMHLSSTTAHFTETLRPTDYNPKESTGTMWSEPPTGMNVDRLKACHMKFFPLNMRKVKEVHLSVLCVPLPGNADKPEERIWIGEVVRRVDYKGSRPVGQPRVEKPAYYGYERDRFSWVPICSKGVSKGSKLKGSEVFQEALDNLDPEMGLFCLLKTEANFGIELRWKQIKSGLESAVDIGFLNQSDVDKYENEVRRVASQAVKTGWAVASDSQAAADLAVEEFLIKEVYLRPRQVMAMLTELGIVKLSPVWKDYVDA